MYIMENLLLVRVILKVVTAVINLLETTFQDIAAVAGRATRATDTSISPDIAKMYAEYMLRMAAWEINNAKATCLKTLSQHLPNLKAQVYDKMNFYSPYIYIGNLHHDFSNILMLFVCRYGRRYELVFLDPHLSRNRIIE